MIVTVSGHHIEGDPPEGLGYGRVTDFQLRHGHKKLRVGVRAALLVIQMAQSAESLNVVLDGLALYDITIETARHKVRPAIFFEQMASGHGDWNA